MEVERNTREFDSRQIELLRWMGFTVKQELQRARIPEKKIPKLIEALLFHVACVIDGSTVMNYGDKTLKPILTFAKDEAGEELIAASRRNGSWMHEYAIGIAEEIINGKWDPLKKEERESE